MWNIVVDRVCIFAHCHNLTCIKYCIFWHKQEIWYSKCGPVIQTILYMFMSDEYFMFELGINLWLSDHHMLNLTHNRPIYINWQKPKSKKTWVFCCTVYTARKTHNIRGFWHEKRMREKPRISYWCFGKWCACATSLYLWPYTCSAHYVAGRGRVIPLKVTYHVTKNPNNTGEIGASVYIGKKLVKFRRSFKKSRCGGGFFDSGFLECIGEVA